MLLALAGPPQFNRLHQANAQEGPKTAGIGMPALDLRALGINNEAQRIVSLASAHVKFFKRSSELQQKDILSPREASDFKNEGERRKADLLTLKGELESLISKLKQANHWDATYDVQALAAVKNNGVRSLVSQAGGARKLLEAAVEEISLLREDIDGEVRQIENRRQGALPNRGDRVFAAHARPLPGKAGCNLLAVSILTIWMYRGAKAVYCELIERYNNKGCAPRLDCDAYPNG